MTDTTLRPQPSKLLYGYSALVELLKAHGVPQARRIYLGAENDTDLPAFLGGRWTLVDDYYNCDFVHVAHRVAALPEGRFCKVKSKRIDEVYRPRFQPELVFYRKDREEYAFSVGRALLSAAKIIVTDYDFTGRTQEDPFVLF